jgi:hypothetical protein
MSFIAINPPEVIDSLNCLLRTLSRSLAMYLSDAMPWTNREDLPAWCAIDDLVFDQKFYAQRVAEAISERDGRLDPGSFPTAYTAIHDLSLEFLYQKVIESHCRDIETIERCASELDDYPALESLAEEILGNARGHLELLGKKRLLTSSE